MHGPGTVTHAYNPRLRQDNLKFKVSLSNLDPQQLSEIKKKKKVWGCSSVVKSPGFKPKNKIQMCRLGV